MTAWDQRHSDVLAQHAKPIAHMWRQIRERRFGLVLGAGVSNKFDVPDWYELLKRISDAREVRGADVLASQEKMQASSIAQTLFQRFAGRLSQKDGGGISKGEIRRRWRDIVRRQLYKKATKKVSTYLRDHYIREYLPIIKRIPMTVTYNFDDFLERFLEWQRDTEGSGHARGKPYETIWRPDIQTRRRLGVIYHPNGFLPKNEAEPASDGLVFCEEEFADQLIESIAGRYASLLHFLSRYTCLLIGLSLNDATLKHLLRQNAQLNPGHFHYYVVYEDARDPMPEAVQNTVYEANLEVHNLITLFLTAEQIAALGFILNYDDAHELLGRAKDASACLRYYYYVTGVPCAGKSSSIACLRSYVTYDEWLDARLPEMSQRTQLLPRERTRVVDKWVASQFDEKNRLLKDAPEKEIGIHLLDRCILDPMSFKPKGSRAKRARTLLDRVCGASREEGIRAGMVFLLKGDPKVIVGRCRAAGKDFTRDDLGRMQVILGRAYRGKHLRTIETRNTSRAEVVKKMVRSIYLDQYKTIDLKRRLMDIEERRLKW